MQISYLIQVFECDIYVEEDFMNDSDTMKKKITKILW